MIKIEIIVNEFTGIIVDCKENLNLPATKWEKEVVEKFTDMCKTTVPPDYTIEIAEEKKFRSVTEN